MEKGSVMDKPDLCSLCGCKYFHAYDPRDRKRNYRKSRRINFKNEVVMG